MLGVLGKQWRRMARSEKVHLGWRKEYVSLAEMPPNNDGRQAAYRVHGTCSEHDESGESGCTD